MVPIFDKKKKLPLFFFLRACERLNFFFFFAFSFFLSSITMEEWVSKGYCCVFCSLRYKGFDVEKRVNSSVEVF